MSSRMLKKSASLSCSFGLFGLSRLSGLSRVISFFGSKNKANQIDQMNQTDQANPDMRAIRFLGSQQRYAAAC